jgi:hypothetical protein
MAVSGIVNIAHTDILKLYIVYRCYFKVGVIVYMDAKTAKQALYLLQ